MTYNIYEVFRGHDACNVRDMFINSVCIVSVVLNDIYIGKYYVKCEYLCGGLM